jgi:tetratricopeptide (TPR) repeat protein
MTKTILSLLLLFLLKSASATDTLVNKRKVLIGPPELVLPPPVDSALLVKLLVGEKLKKKFTEQADFKNRQNLLILNSLLLDTETAVEPNANLIGTLEEVLSEYLRTGDTRGQALIYTTYGVYYGRYGQPEKATYYFLEALKLKESLKDEAGILKITQNLSAIYRSTGQYDQAIKFAEYSVATSLRMNRTVSAARTYLDIASMKFLQRKYKESETYILHKAFPMFRRTGNKIGRMNCFQTLAELYFQQKRYSEAKWFYIQSKIMAGKLLDNQAMITSLTGLGRVKTALGDHEEALQDYREAEQLALRNNYIAKLVEINADLGEVYNEMGNYPAAGAALDQYTKFRESWISSNQL